MSDLVNHPPHYCYSKIEVIDVIESFDLNFNVGNVVKYCLRHTHKGNPLQDLQKAKWYLEREIKKYESQNIELQPTYFAGSCTTLSSDVEPVGSLGESLSPI